jgi:hypothetical protein
MTGGHAGGVEAVGGARPVPGSVPGPGSLPLGAGTLRSAASPGRAGTGQLAIWVATWLCRRWPLGSSGRRRRASRPQLDRGERRWTGRWTSATRDRPCRTGRVNAICPSRIVNLPFRSALLGAGPCAGRLRSSATRPFPGPASQTGTPGSRSAHLAAHSAAAPARGGLIDRAAASVTADRVERHLLTLIDNCHFEIASIGAGAGFAAAWSSASRPVGNVGRRQLSLRAPDRHISPRTPAPAPARTWS